MRTLFLFQTASSSTGLNVFALFTPAGDVYIHIVDPSSQRQSITGLRDTYAQFWNERPMKNTFLEPPEALTFHAAYHGSEDTAMKAISKNLTIFENKPHLE